MERKALLLGPADRLLHLRSRNFNHHCGGLLLLRVPSVGEEHLFGPGVGEEKREEEEGKEGGRSGSSQWYAYPILGAELA